MVTVKDPAPLWLEDAVAILRDLAAKEPKAGSEWIECGCCGADLEDGPHVPTCPWLRAKRLIGV